jgi:hypothetical protein
MNLNGMLSIIIYMNVGKCDLTLSTSTFIFIFIFCSIQMKATSQITISTSFTSLWAKNRKFQEYRVSHPEHAKTRQRAS